MQEGDKAATPPRGTLGKAVAKPSHSCRSQTSHLLEADNIRLHKYQQGDQSIGRSTQTTAIGNRASCKTSNTQHALRKDEEPP